MCQPSDVRLKDRIEPVAGGLSLVQALRPVRYHWRSSAFPERRLSTNEQIGFIAQEVQKVLPEVVSQGADGMYAVDYARLTPVLVQAIQDQQVQIDELKSMVAQLLSKMEEQSAIQHGSR
jgi:hypothetical protein